MEPYLRKPGLNLNLDNLRKVHRWRPKFFTLSLLNEGYKCTQFETNLKDIGGNRLVISHGYILMAAQKCQKKIKNCWQLFFWCAFLNVCKPKTQLIKALNSLDSSTPYWRLLENCKDRRLQRVISAWKWFWNLLHSQFSKKLCRIWRPGNQWLRHEIQTWNFFHALLHVNSVYII